MFTDIVLIIIGLVAGIINSIAGGGMILGFPALIAAGVPALSANATANIVVLPGQLASAWGYRRELRKLPRRYLWLLLPVAIGSALGAVILRHTTGSQFEHVAPYLIVLAIALFAAQPFLHAHGRRSMQRGVPLLVIGLLLLVGSIYGGYFGVGFGFVTLAILSLTTLPSIHEMNGLKNLLAACIAAVDIIFLFHGHYIYWHTGIFMAVGNIGGGYLGARFAQRVPVRMIRYAVICFGVIVAAYFVG
ncbi:MAG TPA: sulfite exporter TauE/SafE family protein [Candidatus Saccharimonadales bacterium]|nr:sulfite exporter TauE/SafE family protein [Candidatus Saccharimonadales bacterium]